MTKNLYPQDGAHITFTDMSGIERKGVYKKSMNGYQEFSEVELPDDPGYVFPEDEIVEWSLLSDESQTGVAG